MRRLSSRRVPPANSVPVGTSPVRPPRPRRSADGRRTRRTVAATGAVAIGAVSVAFATGHLIILAIAALNLIVAAAIFVVSTRISNRHSVARTPMIQDMLKGIFGVQTPPVSQPQIESPEPIPQIVAPEIAPEPAKPRASEHPKLPTVVKPVVDAIESKIERILKTIGPVGLGDTTPKEMTDLRDVHLPALIASYVDIPADHRAQIFREKGKSASYVLKDSLDVIAGRLDGKIAELAKREISSFDDANRFIADRYGNKEDPFS